MKHLKSRAAMFLGWLLLFQGCTLWRGSKTMEYLDRPNIPPAEVTYRLRFTNDRPMMNAIAGGAAGGAHLSWGVIFLLPLDLLVGWRMRWEYKIERANRNIRFVNHDGSVPPSVPIYIPYLHPGRRDVRNGELDGLFDNSSLEMQYSYASRKFLQVERQVSFPGGIRQIGLRKEEKGLLPIDWYKDRHGADRDPNLDLFEVVLSSGWQNTNLHQNR